MADRLPTLSPSKITTFLACPTKFYWTYIDPKGRWYLRSKSYYSFGTTLHNVLQRFHDSGDTGVTTTAEAVAALEESWIESGYSSQDEMMQAMAEGKAIVETYVEAKLREPVTSQTLMVEKLLKKDMGEFILNGRIDRVEEWDDGTLEIVDYKSGRLGVTEDDILSDLAMSCYQVLLREKFPDRTIVASIVALRTGKKATAGLDRSELDRFVADLQVLGGMIIGQEWEGHSPLKKPLCASCDFLPLCSRSEGWEA